MNKKNISFSKKIKNLVAEVAYFLIIKTSKFPKIASDEDTIQKIIDDKCSIARFGDSEIKMLNAVDVDFQKANEQLSQRLKEIVNSDCNNILIGITPIYTYNDLKNVKSDEKLFWKKELVLWRKKYKIIRNDKQYYNAFITRPYMRYIDRSNSPKIFEKLKEIWNDREIVIIEGSESRLGVRNDLFDNARKIERILCPSKDAFEKYDEILEKSLKLKKDKLILIALGLTATVLSYDLAQNGYQALDIGHIDIEYEWMKMGALEKVKVTGKYTNEVEGGNIVEILEDEKYKNQIIMKIDNN